MRYLAKAESNGVRGKVEVVYLSAWREPRWRSDNSARGNQQYAITALGRVGESAARIINMAGEARQFNTFGLFTWDDWKHDLREMPVIVVNRVHSGGRSAVVVERLPCVRINIKTREIATGDVEADAVTFLEDHCGRIHVYRNLIDVLIAGIV
jgi:hypothetical protein